MYGRSRMKPSLLTKVSCFCSYTWLNLVETLLSYSSSSPVIHCKRKYFYRVVPRLERRLTRGIMVRSMIFTTWVVRLSLMWVEFQFSVLHSPHCRQWFDVRMCLNVSPGLSPSPDVSQCVSVCLRKCMMLLLFNRFYSFYSKFKFSPSIHWK